MIQQFVAPQAQTELVSEYSAIRPGQTFKVALRMKMEPNWHSYYLNPGESGQATSIRWNLPKGFIAGPIQWPSPTRKVTGGVAGYVYEDEVWLITELQSPSNLAPNGEVKLGAEAKWLLCREACVPQKANLSVFVRIDSKAVRNEAFRPAIFSEPNFQPIPKLHASFVTSKKIVTLTVEGVGEAVFYPADPNYFGADLPFVNHTKSTIRFQIPLSRYAAGTPKRLVGILSVRSGLRKGAHWVDVPLGIL